MEFSNSKDFFEIADEDLVQLNTFHGRLLCLKDFLKRLAILPFALLYKAYKTFFRALGVLLTAGLILITLGTSCRLRELFVERVSSFAKDLADWLLLPFAILTCFFRLILAFAIHPQMYFNH
ncbi:MAG TPA: hypothetical protein VLE89_00595 [Chlamydiales bacterium]|nr:hypothetical protein [Chlamydiales bacterium]